MPHRRRASPGFTLVEVMVAVVIISVVIAALLQLFSNNTHFFSQIDERRSAAWATTVLIGNTDYGLSDDETTFDKLVSGYKVDDALRQTLKETEIRISYKEVASLDSADFTDTAEELIDSGEVMPEEEASDAAAALEIGRTSLRTEHAVGSFLRFRLQ